jgi:hypothetical protein
VDVGDGGRLRLRHESFEIPEQRLLDGAVDVEPPARAGNIRRKPEVEDRPVLRQMLPGRKALLLRARGFSGEEAALARPAFLGAGELALRRFVALRHPRCPFDFATMRRYSWRCIIDSCLVSRMVV